MGFLCPLRANVVVTLAFVWLNLKGMYPPELRSTNLDFEWVYRRVMPAALQSTFSAIWRVDSAIRQAFQAGLKQTLDFIASRYEGPSRLLSSTFPAGSMVMWVAVILATYLLLSFIH